MQMPIEKIIVKKRIRRDMGDIPALAESLKRFGLINPIVVNRKDELVAGGRRLEAARYLGWRTIDALILDAPEKLTKLEYEIEENIQRREFSAEEIALATRELQKLRHPGFFRRIWNAVVRFFTKLFKPRTL
jgi:ParB family chromosome partitioning protein